MPDDPWEMWRRAIRDDPFLNSMFKDLDKEMDRMREVMTRFMQQAQDAQAEMGKDPMVFGFSMRMGPDGMPRFEEFGTNPTEHATGPGIREPLVDVVEGATTVSVTAELPGVEKENVKLKATRDRLMVRGAGDGRRYEKSIHFPVPVRPETAKATFKNGILDVELERESPEDEGHEVTLE